MPQDLSRFVNAPEEPTPRDLTAQTGPVRLHQRELRGRRVAFDEGADGRECQAPRRGEVAQRLYRAGMLRINRGGLYKPRR